MRHFGFEEEKMQAFFTMMLVFGLVLAYIKWGLKSKEIQPTITDFEDQHITPITDLEQELGDVRSNIQSIRARIEREKESKFLCTNDPSLEQLLGSPYETELMVCRNLERDISSRLGTIPTRY